MKWMMRDSDQTIDSLTSPLPIALRRRYKGRIFVLLGSLRLHSALPAFLPAAAMPLCFQ